MAKSYRKDFELQTLYGGGEELNCYVEIDFDKKRIQIWCEMEDYPGNFEPYATASTIIPGLAYDEWAIKNWSENAGMVEIMESLGIIFPPHRYDTSGYVFVPICKLRPEVLSAKEVT